MIRHRTEQAFPTSDDQARAFGLMQIVVLLYMAAIAGAESVGAFLGVIPGVLLHAVLLVLLLNHYILISRPPSGHYGKPSHPYWWREVLAVLALIPLLRILSVTMVIRELPQIYWYGTVGLPMLVAIAFAVRLQGHDRFGLDLRFKSWLLELPIALAGLTLGLAAFLVWRPSPIIAPIDRWSLLVGAAVLTVFTGLTEEMLFRGLIQRALMSVFGPLGILWSAVLFAVTYIGSQSLGYVVFIGFVGLLFGLAFNKSGSILGVTLAHSLMNIGMLLVWPFLLSR